MYNQVPAGSRETRFRGENGFLSLKKTEYKYVLVCEDSLRLLSFPEYQFQVESSQWLKTNTTQ